MAEEKSYVIDTAQKIPLDNDRECYTLAPVPRKRPSGQMNWRPSQEDVKLLTALSKKLGITESNVIRLGLRCLVEKESGILQRVG